jgi:hypothetical protein
MGGEGKRAVRRLSAGDLLVEQGDARAHLEDGARTATLRAKTGGKVVGVPGEELNREALEQVAAARPD